MWNTIKKWLGLADLNTAGKVSAEDLELARALAEKGLRAANEEINKAAEKPEAVKKVKRTTKKK
jgi:hypothetical protein